ncbi:nucleoside triphosphate pyrophosphohydrolase [Marinospirillum sp.]|uniref:nucleoside triphosphate pyrophosphohydrolase n=1 Tax=Marinospirillum sp. TaxID=2183934 RepID=UPI00286FFD48|nr:nucleoside triphosphate pyrophosphohydrolase [Marinospirillum sp.]MDR9467133.1 nucleoside triphosphate pyrophosphohydrolase [Marinospirillum sp.]
MAQYSLQDLLTLMARLRDPQDGCPWDLKQTWESIVPHTLEEAYEVADCIERGDLEHLQEELGDLLFQVVYYSRFGEEENRFDFHQVVDGLTRKLIRRHPHVFPEGTLESRVGDQKVNELEVNNTWETLKAEERKVKQQATSILDGIPANLPAVTRALKLQKRAARVGFDWGEAYQVLDKLEEELAEIREALAEGNQAAVADEVGDFLFASVNLARHLKVDPEAAVRSTNRKFERRFKYVEQQSALNHPNQQVPLETLEGYWQEAKRKESPDAPVT